MSEISIHPLFNPIERVIPFGLSFENHMKCPFLKLIALTLLLGVGPARSQTLNWSSLTGSEMADSQGEVLEGDTFLFELGAFEEGFVPDESNVGQWVENWRIFDMADYQYDELQVSAYFTGTANVQDVSQYTEMFEGLKAYIFIRDTSSSEFFLASSVSWVFPDADPGCCPNGEVTTWSVSQLGTPVWGGLMDERGGGDYSAQGPFDIQTHGVPEPGPAVLFLLGCASLMLQRRRGRP